jgi:hypothetical protein
VYREPYGVTLIICPFNGPLLLSLRPAIAALSAGNPCILKLSEALLATDELLQELIPKYFEPESLSAVLGAKETVTNLIHGMWRAIQRRARSISSRMHLSPNSPISHRWTDRVSLATNHPEHFEVAHEYEFGDFERAIQHVSRPGKTGIVLLKSLA